MEKNEDQVHTVPIDGEDNDSASERSPSPQKEDHPTRVLTKRRVQDNLFFSQWVRDQQGEIEQSIPLRFARGDDQSVTSLVRQAESQKIINSPREYQVELFEKAKQKNIIAVLDTGTGKTLIAALLLRHTIGQELEDRKAGKPSRLSFFVVDKVSLVFQQYEVFNCNLDYNIARFCGDSVATSDTTDFWKRQTEENMVIVCTADILLYCLHHSFVKMAQINLLIFDEAHHTKKNHPYARIMKDFYAPLEKADLRRPRILGMTASPIDSKSKHVDIEAARLEGLLHSEITTVDYTQFSTVINPPEDTVVHYFVRGPSFETPLWQKLSTLVGNNAILGKLFIYSEKCTKELGPWCADRVWQICLTEDVVKKVQARLEKEFAASEEKQPVSHLNDQRSAVSEAFRTVSEHPFCAVERAPRYLSNKVEVLMGVLNEQFNPATDKCIIFVEQRWTAILLEDLFKQPGLGLDGINPGILLGGGAADAIGRNVSLRDQVVTMSRFRRGDLNCLFATSVAEEGLDIPDCNIAIRFDLSKTLIQYIQSRGRARQFDSKYFHLIDRCNRGHEQALLHLKDAEENLRLFCQLQPDDRLIRGCDFGMDHWAGQNRLPTYQIPRTGAMLTYRYSLVVLANFVSSLPHPLDVTYTPQYTVSNIGTEFICEVLLPDNSPVSRMMGTFAPSKQIAKCSAAFKACLKLHKNGFLDDDLRPVYVEQLPSMRNAHLALSSKKQAEYTMRVKPDIWNRRGVPVCLFVTVLRLRTPTALDRPSRPLAILTREPLPAVAKFPLFFGSQRTSEVDCIPLSSAIDASSDEIDVLNAFTLRLFQDIFSKEYKSEPEKMPYFLAPLLNAHEFDFATCKIAPHALIDWPCMSSVHATSDDIEWKGQPDQIFEDRFVTDPYDGSRKFYTVRRRHDLKPTDAQLATAPASHSIKKAAREAKWDIWNYSISLWSKSRARIAVREDLPVVEAEFIPLRRNLLDEFEKVDNADLKCYLVLQTLKLSALPTDVVAMAYTLPAIIFRLENNFIALDACKSLGLDIPPDLALEALTKDSDNSDEHSEEQVNFQRGMGRNYERLEFLGDSFLKMSTTISLFVQMPENDEYFYHVDRMVMVCNQNLFNNALELKLQESIRSKAFNRRVWYPEGLELLKGKQNTSILGRKGLGRGVHRLADKTIADVGEAIIGAAYLTTHESKNIDMAIQAVTKLVNNDFHRMMKFDDFLAAYTTPDWQTAPATAVHEDLVERVEAKLGYRFRYPRLLRSAFTHGSYGTVWERIPSYQRLEFLGDALLDMTCVDYLFRRFPEADPQWLTEHRMAMVSNQFLGCLCVELDLHRHLVTMSGTIQREVADYVVAVTEAREQAETEVKVRARSQAAEGKDPSEPTDHARARDYWIDVQKPPKCLPDVVESYMGAMFVDSGFDLGRVQEFFDSRVLPYFRGADMRLYDSFAARHPVTHLAHTLQRRLGCDHWRLLVEDLVSASPAGGGTKSQVVCGALVHGRVREHAVAASGRYAKIAAAKKLLARLEDLAPADYRREFGCDCALKTANAEDAGGADPDFGLGPDVDLSAHGTAI